MRIETAVALVTGGGRGLGRAIAEHLAALGAVVVVADRDEAALADLPSGITGVVLDVTQPDDARVRVAELATRHGRIDILVNNAGVIVSEPFVNPMRPDALMHDYARFRHALTVNLDSVFIMTSAVVEAMVTRRTRGAIVNISSISAGGNEGQTAYAAAKAGVEAMTITWAKELGRWGIRCNAVAPGFVDTPSTRAALSAATIKHLESATPLRRLGAPTEVAAAVVAAVENDFMTGAVLRVDGGLRL